MLVASAYHSSAIHHLVVLLQVSQLQSDFFSPPTQGGPVRPINRKRGYSESAPNSPLIPIKPPTGTKRPGTYRQRGYSDASSFSDCSAPATVPSTCPSQTMKKHIIEQYPPGPGGNPKLDNSALQGIWDIYRKEAGDYDAAMIDSWNASIDNLILFVR